METTTSLGLEVGSSTTRDHVKYSVWFGMGQEADSRLLRTSNWYTREVSLSQGLYHAKLMLTLKLKYIVTLRSETTFRTNKRKIWILCSMTSTAPLSALLTTQLRIFTSLVSKCKPKNKHQTSRENKDSEIISALKVIEYLRENEVIEVLIRTWGAEIFTKRTYKIYLAAVEQQPQWPQSTKQWMSIRRNTIMN